MLFEALEDKEDIGDDNETVHTMGIKEFLVELTCAHYVWIKGLGALIRGQVGRNTNKKYICNHCLHYFHSD